MYRGSLKFLNKDYREKYWFASLFSISEKQVLPTKKEKTREKENKKPTSKSKFMTTMNVCPSAHHERNSIQPLK